MTTETLSIPVSIIPLKCCTCEELQPVFVCFCGQDVCVPCAKGHQSRCAFAQEKEFKDKPKIRGII